LLPSSEDIIKAIEGIIKVFESPIEIEVLRQRWEEIKKYQDPQLILSPN